MDNNRNMIARDIDCDGDVDDQDLTAWDAANGANCPADLTGDGELNFFDVSAFLSAYSSNDPVADFTKDGEFNFFDVSAFLAAYGAGCP